VSTVRLGFWRDRAYSSKSRSENKELSMKPNRSIIAFALASAALVSLSGCASGGYVVADDVRIDRAERMARANNTQLIWVNSPTKRVDSIEERKAP
jgi:hypothetical protein